MLFLFTKTKELINSKTMNYAVCIAQQETIYSFELQFVEY